MQRRCRRAESAPPSSSLAAARSPSEIRPTGTIHYRSPRKKGRGGGCVYTYIYIYVCVYIYKKKKKKPGENARERSARGEEDGERKEQVLVLKRATMRGGGEPTGWFLPLPPPPSLLSGALYPRSARKRGSGRRPRHRMVSAWIAVSGIRQESAGRAGLARLLFRSRFEAPRVSRSSEFIVRIQVSHGSLGSALDVSYSSECARDSRTSVARRSNSLGIHLTAQAAPRQKRIKTAEYKGKIVNTIIISTHFGQLHRSSRCGHIRS